jgi:YHS domain-containing protein
MTSRRSTFALVGLCLSLAALSPSLAQAQGKAPAIDGYDPVAYFTEKKPVQGKAEISHVFDEKRYLFSSTKHRDLFAASPERYEPQFNGLCAGGVSKGNKVKADPTIWRVIDGKLYVYSTQMANEETYAKLATAAQSRWKAVK